MSASNFKTPSQPPRPRGFTLIEVLVATTLLAVGIVGLLAALSGSVQASSSALARDGAVELAANQLTLARTAPVNARVPSTGVSDRYQWTTASAQGPDGTTVARVGVTWQDRGRPNLYVLSELLPPEPQGAKP